MLLLTACKMSGLFVTVALGMLCTCCQAMLQFLQCLAVGTGLTALLATAGGHAGYEMAPFIPSLEAVIVALLRVCTPSSEAALRGAQHSAAPRPAP